MSREVPNLFSPNDLLHYVFADGNDLYCCNEVLALDLNQYLWLQLHEQGYGCVYYLDLDGDEASVRTCGDKLAQSYTPEKPHWGLNRQRIINSGLQKWILKQLTEKGPRRSAIVCELHEFCSTFSGADWMDFFKDLAALGKRTGIIVLTAPPEAEASRSYFMNSPVFDNLRETGITGLRTASRCDMYTAMHRSMPDRMLYLNAYTAERIRSMLTRILLEDPKLTMDCDLLPEMTDYLLQWMNNPELRKKDGALEKLLPAPDDSFRSVYDRLRREECWSQFTAKAMQVSKAGGMQRYAEDLGCSLAEDPVGAVCVRRDPNSYAGRCLNLRLRSAAKEGEEQAKIRDLLEEIRRQVVAPCNRDENPKLADKVNSLLPELSSADLTGDAGTVRRILYSINFCIQWIWVPPRSSVESSILTVLDKLQGYIELSRSYYDQKQNLAIARSNQALGKSKLADRALKQMEDKVETTRRMLSSYEDVVQASVVELSMASANGVTKLVQNLTDDLNRRSETAASEAEKRAREAEESLETNTAADDWTQQEEDSGAEQTKKKEPEAPPARKSLDEETFVLTDDDFNLLF